VGVGARDAAGRQPAGRRRPLRRPRRRCRAVRAVEHQLAHLHGKAGHQVVHRRPVLRCSTVEGPPFFGGNEAELRACARAADSGFTRIEITLDGHPVPVTEVETGLLHIDLPEDDIIGTTESETSSVAHGWVALLHPLTPGTHEIGLRVVGTDAFGNDVDLDNTTTIIVMRPR
jgi:hypothetical protein